MASGRDVEVKVRLMSADDVRVLVQDAVAEIRAHERRVKLSGPWWKRIATWRDVAALCWLLAAAFAFAAGERLEGLMCFVLATIYFDKGRT